MGLGKTIQAIAVASIYRSEWPVLVVCPSSLRVQWAEQFERWLRVRQDQIAVVSSAKTKIDRAVVIMSYTLASTMKDKIA